MGPPILQDFTAKAPQKKIILSRDQKIFQDFKFKAASGDPKSMKSIIDLLDCSDSNPQHEIEDFLLQHRHYARDIIIKYLKSSSKSNKSEFIRMLVLFRDERSVKALISLLNKSPIEIKIQVIQALGNIGDKQAILPLIQQLKNSDLKIKKYTLETLLQIDDKNTIIPIINELENSPDEFCDDFFKYLQKNPKIIRKICVNDNDVVQRLWEILLRLLNSEKPSIVSNAHTTLLKILPFSSHHIHEIVEIIPKSSKYAIIKGLGQCKNEIAINYLLEQLKTATGDIHKACIQSLVNNNMTIPIIIKHCETKNFEPIELLNNIFLISEDNDTLKDIVTLLIKLREQSAPFLISRMEKSDFKQRERIKHILLRMNLESLPSDPFIQQLSVCSDDEALLLITHVLGKRGNHLAINPLINLLKNTTNREIRDACSNSLIKIKNLNAIPLLTRLQHHANKDVCKIAEATINGLRGPDINATLRELAAERSKRKAEEEQRRIIEENTSPARRKKKRQGGSRRFKHMKLVWKNRMKR